MGIAESLAADLLPMKPLRANSTPWVISGTYDRMGDQISITANFLRASRESSTMSISVNGPMAELFELQDQLAERLLATMRNSESTPASDRLTAVSPTMAQRPAPTPPPTSTAVSDISSRTTSALVNTAIGPPPPIPPEVLSRDQQGRATIRAIRLEEPLRLDGQLSEAVYQTVKPVTDFIQQLPVEGAPATERTDVWVMFDRDTIYISARCWDSAPDRIIAKDMKRDSYGMFGNDTFSVVLDTFYDRRNGFNFITNPIGGLFDATITNERTPNVDWNTVWDVRTNRSDEGWTLEMSIPFKSLRYQSGPNQLWGINFQRRVASKNETSFLTPIPAALNFAGMFKLSSAATLVGLEVPSSAARFEIKPYAIADLTTDLTANPRIRDQVGGTGGVDVKYGVTQGLTADFTYNTDFAQVEVDEQQVNLTRFSLFFPEKREFFLEGQGVFDFGAGFRMDPVTWYFKGEQFSGEAPILFFSRRIGLDGGQTVPIQGGGRLTGKAGAFSIGLLNVQTGQAPDSNVRGTNFSVVRVKRDILRRSTIGAMFTGRSLSTTAPGASYTYGVDGLFSFYDNLNINTFVSKTETPGLRGDDVSYQAELDYNGDLWGLRLERLGVGANFNPEIGFVRRTDFRRNFAQFRFSPRPQSISSVRKFLFQPSLDYITDGTGTLETRLQQFLFGAEFENSDMLYVGVTDNFEFLKVPFQIAKNVSIPVGGYSFLNTRVVFGLGEHRPISGGVIFDHGGFFGGEKTTVSFYQPRVNIGARLLIEPSISFNWITLPEGAFTSELVMSRLTYSLTPRMFVSGLMQFNSANDSLGTNIRFRWEYQPGSELFVVYTDERNTLTPRYPMLQNRAFVIKFNRLFRF